MISASMQGDVRQMTLARLRMAYQRVRLSVLASLLVSSLVVAVLWQVVAPTVSLTWLGMLWAVLALRYLFARQFFALDQADRAEPGKWTVGFVIGAAATGLCWGLTVFFFPQSPLDSTTLLLVFVIAGVGSFASTSMASIPQASNAFMLSTLLPVALWLALSGQPVMALIAVVYLGLMLLLSYQMHGTVLSYLVSSQQNKVLTSVDQAREARYRAQSNLLHSVLESASDVSVWALDRDYRYLMFNAEHSKNSKKMWGVDIAVGMNALDVVGREELRAFLRHGFELAASGRSFSIETREDAVQDGNTSPEYFEHHSSPICNDDGEVVGLTIFSHNISERKRMEHALEVSHNFLSKVINSISDNISVKDSEHRWILLNDTLCAMIGHPREALLGKSDYEFFPKEQADVFWEKDNLVYQSGQINVNEEALTGADGKTRYLLTQKTPFTFGDGQRYIVAISRDITERKAIEKALRDSEHMLQEAQRIAHVGSWDVDMVNDRLFWSDEIFRIWEIDKTKFKADFAAFLDTVHPQDRERVSQAYNEAIAKHSFYEVEHRLLFPDGRIKYILEQGEPQYDAHGTPVRFIGTSLDITERKQAQQQLELLDRAMDMSADGIFMVDEQLRFNYVNEGACRALGYSREELLTMGPCDIDPHIQREVLLEMVKNAPLGVVNTLESQHRTKDGRTYPVEVAGVQFEEGGKRFALTVVRDITERKQTAREREAQAARLEASRQQLQRTEAWYRGILQSAPDGMLVVNEQGTITLVNAKLCQMFGYADDELIGQSMEVLVPVAQRVEHVAHRDGFIRGLSKSRKMGGGATRLSGLRKDGSEFFVDISLSRPPSIDAGSGAVCAAIRDVTEQQRLERALAEREHESRTLVENTPDTIARYNRDGVCIFANQALAHSIAGGLEAILGRTPTEVPGREQSTIYETKLHEVVATGSNADFELTWLDTNGRPVCSHIRLTAEFDASGSVATVLAVGRDITELNNFRQKIHQMAFYDNLTSLPNRALFHDRLHQVLHDAEWHGQQAGVMLLDLDRFKAINDSLGHPAGDALLREAALRLNLCVRSYDTVARLGGDEFAILLPDIRSGDDLGRVASKILSAFNEPFVLEGNEVFVSTSIGIAVYPHDDTDANGLIKQADSAMYFAKRSGRNNFRFYSKDLTASAAEKLALESELRRALERGELELYYQPQIRLADNQLIGSEALLRWHNPQRGLVPPNQFISIAEDSGLIVEIGQWVLREACRTACEWNGAGKPVHKVAINLSARQFQSSDLVDTVRSVLHETNCQPQWIELEITESLLLDEHGQVLEMLQGLSAMGITIAIDDFGTGYSSLSYLARFPINTLKIDRSFISTITTEHFRGELVKAILSIARCLGQEVVAEGVETQDQAAFLHAHGCQIAQGFLYSKPVPKDAFQVANISKQ